LSRPHRSSLVSTCEYDGQRTSSKRHARGAPVGPPNLTAARRRGGARATDGGRMAAQVGQDPVDQVRLSNEPDDPHRVAALRTRSGSTSKIRRSSSAQRRRTSWSAGGTASASTTGGCWWEPAVRRMPRVRLAYHPIRGTTEALWQHRGKPPSVHATRTVGPGSVGEFRVTLLAKRAGKARFGGRLDWNRQMFANPSRVRVIQVLPKRK